MRRPTPGRQTTKRDRLPHQMAVLLPRLLRAISPRSKAFRRFLIRRRNDKIEIVRSTDSAIVLDREQLRDVTLDDADLMREIVSTLIDDTSRQMLLLQAAISERDAQKCVRVAHYCKGACANVGANSAAAILKQIEVAAARGEFAECSSSLSGLAREINLLRAESVKL